MRAKRAFAESAPHPCGCPWWCPAGIQVETALPGVPACAHGRVRRAGRANGWGRALSRGVQHGRHPRVHCEGRSSHGSPAGSSLPFARFCTDSAHHQRPCPRRLHPARRLCSEWPLSPPWGVSPPALREHHPRGPREDVPHPLVSPLTLVTRHTPVHGARLTSGGVAALGGSSGGLSGLRGLPLSILGPPADPR